MAELESTGGLVEKEELESTGGLVEKEELESTGGLVEIGDMADLAWPGVDWPGIDLTEESIKCHRRSNKATAESGTDELPKTWGFSYWWFSW